MRAGPQILRVGEEPPLLSASGKGERWRSGTKPKGRGTAGQRFKVLNAFADFTIAGLDRAEIVVWLLLWRDTKPDGLARTSQADLARRGGISDRTVRRAITHLRRAGLLRVAHQGGFRRGASVYRVLPLQAPALQPDP